MSSSDSVFAACCMNYKQQPFAVQVNIVQLLSMMCHESKNKCCIFAFISCTHVKTFVAKNDFKIQN